MPEYIDIPKNKTEVIRLKKSSYNGRDFLDIRIFYDKDGEYFPTKKGVTIPQYRLKLFIDAINKLTRSSGDTERLF